MSKPNSIGEQPKSNSLLSTIADISKNGVFHGNYTDSTKRPLDHQQVLAALGDKIGRVNVSPNDAVQDVNMLVSASIYHAFLDFKNTIGDDQEKYENFLNHWEFIANKIQKISDSVPVALESIRGSSPINGYMFLLGGILESWPVQTIVDPDYLTEWKDDFMNLMSKVIKELDGVDMPTGYTPDTQEQSLHARTQVNQILSSDQSKKNPPISKTIQNHLKQVLAKVTQIRLWSSNSSAGTPHLRPE